MSRAWGLRVGAVFAAAALSAGSAGAACWTPTEVAAAEVRDLDAMLMVSALRCRGSAPEVVARYNAFVQADRTALLEVNATLKRHWAQRLGAKAGLDAYDGWVTRLANKYGAGMSDLGCADMASIVEAAASAPPTFAALTEVAERARVQPALDGERCVPAAPVPTFAAAPTSPARAYTATQPEFGAGGFGVQPPLSDNYAREVPQLQPTQSPSDEFPPQ